MFLTNQDMEQLQHTLEIQAGLNEELIERCGPLMHVGKYTEAVRTACVLLEEKLKAATQVDNKFGIRLVDHAFDPEEGKLAKHLGKTPQERKGLHDLFGGAFRLFRNPVAHGAVTYDATEAKSILGFINLLLAFLAQVEELPPPETFIEPVENAIEFVDQAIGPAEASRLGMFLSKCQRLGLKPVRAKRWLPFRSYALQNRSIWDEPKVKRTTVFYLLADSEDPGLWFPVNQYYTLVPGVDIELIKKELGTLGFVPAGKQRDYYVTIRQKNDQAFFDGLYQLVETIEKFFKATL